MSQATPTKVSNSELRDLMMKLQGRYDPEGFDVFAHTSIDFAEEVSQALTGHEILREFTVPVLIIDKDGDGVEWGDIEQYSRTATVAHFPEAMRNPTTDRLSSLFRLWGKRPPNHMRLGPSGEQIGPYLPNMLDGYWEPADGQLVVGSPADADLLEAREKADAAVKGRMLAYARATDQLASPKPAAYRPAAAELRRHVSALRGLQARVVPKFVLRGGGEEEGGGDCEVEEVQEKLAGVDLGKGGEEEDEVEGPVGELYDPVLHASDGEEASDRACAEMTLPSDDDFDYVKELDTYLGETEVRSSLLCPNLRPINHLIQNLDSEL